MERDRFLSRVAGALLTARIPVSPEVPRTLPEPTTDDLVALFRTRAQDTSAVVHGPVGRHGAAKALQGIAAGHDASTFIAWEDLPASGVAAALEGSGLTRVAGEVPRGPDREHLGDHAQVDLGITGAEAALAESGSVVLVHGPGRPRMASLVADVHVALVETGSMRLSLAHWAELEPDVVASTANLVVVTGPSRSGDIELELNLGVHGPRHVHVVLID